MAAIAGLVLLLGLGPGLAPDVSKQDVIRLLSERASEGTILVYIRQNQPVQMLSSQDITDLIAAGASDAVIQELLTGATPAPAQGPGTVLENPSYYPYYYTYYDHYYPPFYTYPYYSFYFYEPFHYRHRPGFAYRPGPYQVRRFPYYGHRDWRQHPSYPYHPFDGRGVHPWRDGRPGAHGFGPRPGGGVRGGGVRSGRGGRP